MRSLNFRLGTCALAIVLGNAQGLPALASSMKFTGIQSPSEPTLPQTTMFTPEVRAEMPCTIVVTGEEVSSKKTSLAQQPSDQMTELAHGLLPLAAEPKLAVQPRQRQLDTGEANQAIADFESSPHPTDCAIQGGQIDRSDLANAGALLAPSVQYILPDEPYDWAHLHIAAHLKPPLAGLRKFT